MTDAEAFARQFEAWNLTDGSISLEGRVRPDGGFEAICPSLPGVYVEGDTLVELAENLRIAALDLHGVRLDATNIVYWVTNAAQRAGLVPLVRDCN